MSAFALLFGFLFIAVPILVMTGVIIIVYLNRKRIGQKTVVPRNWRVVKARITAASVEETVRTRPDDDAFYYPSIQFEYTEAGRTYKGTQAVGRPYNVISNAWQTLSHYQVGKEITVYCNPDDPGEARLWVK